MTTQAITMHSNEEMMAIIAKLQAENAALKAQPAKRLTLKVTEKGGLSLYGLGRFPVTLYRSQWEKLIAAHEEITAFIAANASLLTTKE